jgi:Cu/Ag efflux protein CusF
MTQISVAIAFALSASLLSTAALALTQSKTGAVKSTDVLRRELVLTTGDKFQVSKNIKLSKLKVGDKITIKYAIKDRKLMASKVTPAR